MHLFITCLTDQHDWRFVAGALLLCIAGLATTVVLMSLARAASGRRRLFYGISAATIAALSVWATHFLAMMGYRTGAEVRYDGLVTLASLAIICVSLAVSMLLVLGGRGPLRRMTAGMAAAASVAAMHFVGLSAVTISGVHMVLDPTIVGVSIAVSLGFASLTAFSRNVPRQLRMPASTALGVATVVALHFGSMSAITLEPSPTTVAVGGMSQTLLLIVLLAVVSLTIAIAALVTCVDHLSRNKALIQLREAIEAMPDGLAFYDADDRLVAWNSRYAEVCTEMAPLLRVGLSFEQLAKAGLKQNLYVGALGKEEAWLASRMEGRRTGSTLMENAMANGQWLRLQDRRTKAGGTVTVITDISALKQDACALAEARDAAESANLAKSVFLANMSHEIRTPLNGVIGLAQALARTDLTPAQSEMLDLIQSSGQTLQTLLSDILDLARIESGRIEIADEPFELGRAVQDAAQLYASTAAEKRLQFFVDIEPDADVWVSGDAVRVKQILTNLVSNAVKFTTQGFVSLRAARGVNAEGLPVLRFTVEDTGVGFDSEARERLFTRFEQADSTITRRFGGTGLGLAICRQLAGAMNGDLDCESEAGGGSAFILTLPFVAANAVEHGHSLEVDTDPCAEERPVRVLLADDHPTNRRVVEVILDQVGVEIVSVEDGSQALTAFRAQAFDLVLMDMQMPVMDGLTAIREIRRHEAAVGSQRTPVVLLTANALPEHVAAGVAAGADRHISKPFNAVDLIELVVDLRTSTADALAA